MNDLHAGVMPAEPLRRTPLRVKALPIDIWQIMQGIVSALDEGCSDDVI